MFNYKKLEECQTTIKKNKKSDILDRYQFSKAMKIMFYFKILSIKKCGLKSI